MVCIDLLSIIMLWLFLDNNKSLLMLQGLMDRAEKDRDKASGRATKTNDL